MKDHLNSHHFQKQRIDRGQPSVSSTVNARFKTPFKPTGKQIAELESLESKVQACEHLRQGFFGSDLIVQRDKCLLEIANCDPAQLQLLGSKTKYSNKKNLRQNSEKVKRALNEVGSQLAELGVFNYAIDHKSTGSTLNSVYNDCLGVVLTLTLNNERESYMLAFQETPGTGYETTKTDLEPIIKVKSSNFFFCKPLISELRTLGMYKPWFYFRGFRR